MGSWKFSLFNLPRWELELSRSRRRTIERNWIEVWFTLGLTMKEWLYKNSKFAQILELLPIYQPIPAKPQIIRQSSVRSFFLPFALK